MLASMLVLAAVFLLIAVRRVGGRTLQIWQIMVGGAIAVLLAGAISPKDALYAINADVMVFLFGMFVVGQALEESGYLSHIAYKLFKRAKSTGSLLLFILFGMGFASAFLMNDTLAIVGTPVVLLLAKKYAMTQKPLLMSLAFAVTIGSAASPIGNPQNLLIAVEGGMTSPFTTFLKFLFVPTVLNLFLAYIIIRLTYREHFHERELAHSQEPIRDRSLARLSKISLAIMIFMILLKVFFSLSGLDAAFRLTYIALASALPILVFSPKRAGILKRVDWHTLLFFAGMFVLMESVWEGGFFQSVMEEGGVDVLSVPAILIVSVLVSQFISNVPLVALYLPVLAHGGAGTRELLALAAGSTIAGNLSILGAASNVIVIQNAEKRGGESLTFLDFARIGVPLTLANVLVYYVFL